MTTIPKKPTSGAIDDPNIPVLTDRLGFPPLEFDTTLPLIDSTLGKFEDSALNIPTVQPLEPPNADAPPTARTYPPSAPAAGAVPPRSAELPTTDFVAAPHFEGVQVYGGAFDSSVNPAALFATARPPEDAAASAPALPDTDIEPWASMETELREAILCGLAEQLPLELEAAVQAQMSPVIDRLVAEIAAQARVVVAASTRTIVEQAVRAQIERLRQTRRGSN